MINLMIANVLLTMAQIDHLIYFSRHEAPYVKRTFKRGVFNIVVGFAATIIFGITDVSLFAALTMIGTLFMTVYYCYQNEKYCNGRFKD